MDADVLTKMNLFSKIFGGGGGDGIDYSQLTGKP
jgi:hypothetical protein